MSIDVVGTKYEKTLLDHEELSVEGNFPLVRRPLSLPCRMHLCQSNNYGPDPQHTDPNGYNDGLAPESSSEGPESTPQPPIAQSFVLGNDELLKDYLARFSRVTPSIKDLQMSAVVIAILNAIEGLPDLEYARTLT
ncbi:Uncharacterized protein Fot_27960 [Forsythia ovata]|uniref:Uncharacterized protein n=1 Tax=Forsythia ovata TaxID=205694 RepID=A0ABD1TMN1_9LAMI